MINSGLTAIKTIFSELTKKGKLAPINKVGIRRILLEYVDANCHMSVMFMMSPAEFNAAATTSTLYFAKSAQLVKVVPQKAKVRVNYKKVAAQQKEVIEALTMEIGDINIKLDEMYPDGRPDPAAEKAEAERLEKERIEKEKKRQKKLKKLRKKNEKKKKKKGKYAEPLEEGGRRVSRVEEMWQNLSLPDDRPLQKIMSDKVNKLSDSELMIRVEALEFKLDVAKDLTRKHEQNQKMFVEYLERSITKLQKKTRELQKVYGKLVAAHDKAKALHPN